MEKTILEYQNINIVEEIDDVDEVDGMRFSTFSGGGCGNWSVLSIVGC